MKKDFNMIKLIQSNKIQNIDKKVKLFWVKIDLNKESKLFFIIPFLNQHFCQILKISTPVISL